MVQLPDGYRMVRTLGGDAWGSTHLAHDVGRGCPVGVETLAPTADPRRRERFLREIGQSASLGHPHILQIHTAGELSGTASPTTSTSRTWPRTWPRSGRCRPRPRCRSSDRSPTRWTPPTASGWCTPAGFDGTPYIVWTKDGSNVLAYADGSTADDLIRWWQSGVAGPN